MPTKPVIDFDPHSDRAAICFCDDRSWEDAQGVSCEAYGAPFPFGCSLVCDQRERVAALVIPDASRVLRTEAVKGPGTWSRTTPRGSALGYLRFAGTPKRFTSDHVELIRDALFVVDVDAEGYMLGLEVTDTAQTTLWR